MNSKLIYISEARQQRRDATLDPSGPNTCNWAKRTREGEGTPTEDVSLTFLVIYYIAIEHGHF